jgi:hypothetical protein
VTIHLTARQLLAKPCPCCGGRGFRAGHLSAMSLGIECSGCGLNIYRTVPFKAIRGIRTINQIDRYLLDKAIEAWNRRAKP